jgi:signal transduction histidine kinase
MRERVSALGGSLLVTSSNGDGTQLQAVIPVAIA